MAVGIGLVSAHAGAAFQGSTLPALVGAGPRATCQRASVSLKMVESYYDKAQKEKAAQAASLVPEVILDLHVAAPLAHDGGNAVLGADRVSRCPKKRAKGRYYPVARLVSPEWPVHVACGRRESPSVFFAAALSKRVVVIEVCRGVVKILTSTKNYTRNPLLRPKVCTTPAEHIAKNGRRGEHAGRPGTA